MTMSEIMQDDSLHSLIYICTHVRIRTIYAMVRTACMLAYRTASLSVGFLALLLGGRGAASASTGIDVSCSVAPLPPADDIFFFALGETSSVRKSVPQTNLRETERLIDRSIDSVLFWMLLPYMAALVVLLRPPAVEESEGEAINKAAPLARQPI